MYVRSVKVKSSADIEHEYVRIVAAVRDSKGKSRQKVVANLGKRQLLEAMLPQINKFLKGNLEGDDFSFDDETFTPVDASTWGPMLVVRHLLDQLNFSELLKQAKAKPLYPHVSKKKLGPSDWIDRAIVLIASRLTRPSSEHALAAWLESDYVCDQKGSRFVASWKQRKRVKVNDAQLQRWYRTLDRLFERKDAIEVALYHRLKDLFSIQPDLIFYDMTSTYFEGSGPAIAQHGYSRDGKSRLVQVVVGVVMVGGWPIAHHIWSGNTRDVSTVGEVIKDLSKRFHFRQVVFVGDRGMVSQENIDMIEQAEGEWGYLFGMVRRRNPQAEEIIDQATGTWKDCPVGINAQEKKPSPQTRVQEVKGKSDEVRIFVVESEERKEYEQSMRQRSMKRAREALDKVAKRVKEGRLKQPEKIGASVQRALQKHHGHRYWDWELEDGELHIFEHPVHLKREKKYEGKYIIQTDQKDLTAVEAVQRYKDLNQVEQAFRCLKNPLEMRPIYHQAEHRMRAHIFIAALAFLVERLLDKQLRKAKSRLSTTDAMKALETIRFVRFTVKGKMKSGVTPGSSRAREVLKALKITQTRPPNPPKGQETQM